MALDPQANDILCELASKAKPMPTDDRAWLDGYRLELDAITAMQGPAPACTVIETEVAGLAARIYRAGGSGPWPTLLFLHGGGFVAGSLQGYDIPMRHLALRSGWQVVVPDYRLAPEHPYPAAPDDAFAVLRALHGDQSLHVDVARLAVGGDSAGGLLATVTAMQARDTGIDLKLQLLLYPNTDLRPGPLYPSRERFDGVVIRVDELYRSLDAYLGDADRRDAHVSPMLASNLAGLCPTLMITNAFDPLRDEAEVYAGRLRKADVQVEAIRLDGMIHSCLQRGARIEAGDALISRVAERLRSIGVTDTGGA